MLSHLNDFKTCVNTYRYRVPLLLQVIKTIHLKQVTQLFIQQDVQVFFLVFVFNEHWPLSADPTGMKAGSSLQNTCAGP